MEAQTVKGGAEGSHKKDFAKVYMSGLNALTSYWIGNLTASDACVLMFIFDRTARWGKSKERITYNQIQNGVVTGHGERVSSGVYLSRSTVFRSIRRLENYGFISITRSKTTFYGDQPNIIEIDFKLILEKNVDNLRITRTRMGPKNPVKRALLPGVKDYTPPVSKTTH